MLNATGIEARPGWSLREGRWRREWERERGGEGRRRGEHYTQCVIIYALWGGLHSSLSSVLDKSLTATHNDSFLVLPVCFEGHPGSILDSSSDMWGENRSWAILGDFWKCRYLLYWTRFMLLVLFITTQTSQRSRRMECPSQVLIKPKAQPGVTDKQHNELQSAHISAISLFHQHSFV